MSVHKDLSAGKELDLNELYQLALERLNNANDGKEGEKKMGMDLSFCS